MITKRESEIESPPPPPKKRQKKRKREQNKALDKASLKM